MKELERLFETKEGFTLLGEKVEATLITSKEEKFRINKKRFSDVLYENAPENAEAYIMDFLDPVPKVDIAIHVRVRYYKIT